MKYQYVKLYLNEETGSGLGKRMGEYLLDGWELVSYNGEESLLRKSV